MAILKVLVPKGKVAFSNLINYITREDKTRDDLVFTNGCPRDTEMAKRLFYSQFNQGGRKKEFNVRHMIISFLPGEISPEKALEFGKDYMRRIGYDAYQFYMVAHTDKDHVHLHVVMNPISLRDHKAYQLSPREKLRMKEELSELCRLKGLSSINFNERKSWRETGWYEYQNMKYESSNMERLRGKIDYLTTVSSSWEDLVDRAKKAGITMEDVNGDYRIFWTTGFTDKKGKYHKPKRYLGEHLGLDYTKETIVERMRERGKTPEMKRPVDPHAHEGYGWSRYATRTNIRAASDAQFLIYKKLGLTDRGLMREIESLGVKVKGREQEKEALREEIDNLDRAARLWAELETQKGISDALRKMSPEQRKSFAEQDEAVDKVLRTLEEYESLGVDGPLDEIMRKRDELLKRKNEISRALVELKRKLHDLEWARTALIRQGLFDPTPTKWERKEDRKKERERKKERHKDRE